MVASSSGVASAGSGGAPGCGPSTCAGCCDAAGDCQVGQQDEACGLAGGACVACKGVCASNPEVGPGSTCNGWGTMYRTCQAGQCLPAQDAYGFEGECCAFFPDTGCDAQTGECAPP